MACNCLNINRTSCPSSTEVWAHFVSLKWEQGGQFAAESPAYSWRLVRDLSETARNRDLHQLNLALGPNFLKKDLKICIRGIDQLRSGSVYTITMGPSSVSHNRTPIYGRYFVLDISNLINNSGGKSMPCYEL